MVAIDDSLNKLSKTRYTWQELQERPLPEGVDPLKMEAYLHDSEFEVSLSCRKSFLPVAFNYRDTKVYWSAFGSPKVLHWTFFEKKLPMTVYVSSFPKASGALWKTIGKYEKNLNHGKNKLFWRLFTMFLFSVFQRVLQMSPEEFSALPAWKQSNIKKDVGLF